MSTYGVSLIKLTAHGDEVAEMLVHECSGFDKEIGLPGWHVGESMEYHRVHTLIDRGDKVYVLVEAGPGEFRHTDLLRNKPGQMGYVESYNPDTGARTDALMKLPQFS